MCSRPPPIPSVPVEPPAHPLADLLGSWRGNGKGDYPTIKDFEYLEELKFTALTPMVAKYEQRTWNPANGKPMHVETGYIRHKDGTFDATMCDPTGLAHVYSVERSVMTDGVQFKFVSTSITRTTSAKEVTAVERIFTLCPTRQSLSVVLNMAAVGLQMQHHLTSNLIKLDEALTPAEAKAKNEQGAFKCVIDLREKATRDKYAAMTGEHVVNWESTEVFDRLTSGDSELCSLRTSPLLVYCHSGNRSAVVLEQLLKNGFIYAQHMQGGASSLQKLGL
eukprot:Colp12_sorted_trinity150504_noHs@12643